MSADLNTTTQKWSTEAHILFDQMGSVTRGWYREKTFTGKTWNFPRFTMGTAETTKDRHADVVIQDTPDDTVPVTPDIIYRSRMIDDTDAAKSDVEYREGYTRMCWGEVWQAWDKKFRDTLATTSNSETTLPTANTFDFKGAGRMAKVLDQNFAPDNRRYGLIRSGAMEDLTQDSVYINNFNFQNDVIATNVARNVAGFDLRKFQYLGNGEAGSTERRNWVWQYDAVGCGINIKPDIRVDYIPEKLGWLFTVYCSVGFCIIDSKGVQFFDVVE